MKKRPKKENKIEMPKKAFKKEHVKLIRVLRTGSRKVQKEEAAHQASEMKQHFNNKKRKTEESRPAFVVGIRLCEAKLTAKSRRRIKGSSFALSGRRYPIHDEAHARNALARVSQHGTPEEKAKVRAAVAKKYPGIVQEAARLYEARKSKPSTSERTLGAAGDYVGKALSASNPKRSISTQIDPRSKQNFGLPAIDKAAVVGGRAGKSLGRSAHSFAKRHPRLATAAKLGIAATLGYAAYKGTKSKRPRPRPQRRLESYAPLQELSANTMMRASSIALAKGKKEQSGRIKRGLFKSRGGLASRLPQKPKKPTLVQAWRAKVSGFQR